MTTATTISKVTTNVPTRWLPLVRASIILILVVVDVLFVLGIPYFYEQLTTLCALPNCRPLVLTAQDVAMLEAAGLTANFYAITHIIIEIINLLFVNLFCIYYLRRFIDHWMGYVASLIFIGFITMMNVVWAFFEAYPSLTFLGEGLMDIIWIALYTMLYIFPTGRLVPRWSGIFLIGGLLHSLHHSVTDHYDNFTGTTDIYVSVFMLTFVSSIIFQIYRYFFVSTPTERRQSRWVVLGFTFLPIGIFCWGYFIEYLAYQPDMPRVWIHIISLPIITIITVVPFTLAITIAIIEKKLWNLNIVINRTLVYAVVTIIVFLTYVFVIGLLNVIFDVTNNLLVSILATGAVAVSFQIVRQHVQRGVNRMMFGQRKEPQAVLMNLSRQLQTSISPDDLLQTSAMTISQSLKIPYVGIAIRHGQELILQTEYGKNGIPTQTFDLIHRNEAVGELIVGQRSPGEPLNSADQAVLSSVAQQLGAVVLAVRLQTDLQTAREKLVIAREEERRRLRRDLHDGLGPSLASLPLKIDAAIDLIEQGNPSSIDLLVNVKSQTQSLVADVRQVVHNLRPPALDELGLVEAIRGSISRMSHPNGLKIELLADQLPKRLSAAVEVAIYHIVLEAVTNVVKHAKARHCTVKLSKRLDPTYLNIAIQDDGIGLPQPIIPNVGLQSIRERSEELGGSFHISSGETSGTTIQILLPLLERKVEND